MNTEMVKQVKHEMGYMDGTECCATCLHSKMRDAIIKYDRCGVNAFDIPINREGWCKHWANPIAECEAV